MSVVELECACCEVDLHVLQMEQKNLLEEVEKEEQALLRLRIAYRIQPLDKTSEHQQRPHTNILKIATPVNTSYACPQIDLTIDNTVQVDTQRGNKRRGPRKCVETLTASGVGVLHEVVKLFLRF